MPRAIRPGSDLAISYLYLLTGCGKSGFRARVVTSAAEAAAKTMRIIASLPPKIKSNVEAFCKRLSLPSPKSKCNIEAFRKLLSLPRNHCQLPTRWLEDHSLPGLAVHDHHQRLVKTQVAHASRLFQGGLGGSATRSETFASPTHMTVSAPPQ